MSKGISRRQFTRGVLAASLATALKPYSPAWGASDSSNLFDYIVVGSGAGGGPLAARLANAGYKVALLEAGLDPLGPEAYGIDPNTGIIYLIPAQFAAASEDPLLSWAFYVKHYGDQVQQARDPNFVPGTGIYDPHRGIYYPRGSALGGSTAHDAMIWTYPHDDDWEEIAETTGDPSWSPRQMREIFERIERCDYCQAGDRGHGFNGYMPASFLDSRIFDPNSVVFDRVLFDMATAGATLPLSYYLGNTNLDINHPLVARGDVGAFRTPMNVAVQKRISIREHLIATQLAYPDQLFLITGALASKILMDGNKVYGVEFLQDPQLRPNNLYEADTRFDPSIPPSTHRIYARREVILSAGVFNTPQLLKVSGIGPANELTAKGINVVVDSPGVGRNLQDRYEIAVNVALKDEIELYTRCRPGQSDDPCIVAWQTGQWQGADFPFYGPYAINFNYAFRVAKSHRKRRLPDLFIAGQASAFDGFKPGYSQFTPGTLGHTWTWLVLKCHNNNTAGTVTLRSTDPRRMPEINFHSFQEGNDTSGDDLKAVVQAIKLARSYLSQSPAAKHVAAELHPGPEIQTDKDLATYIQDRAWGHHASCTAKIGADRDRMAVLDSSFRVRGVKRLRVVDACALPRIPGFFPVASIMMLGEKAADVILEHAHGKHGREDED